MTRAQIRAWSRTKVWEFDIVPRQLEYALDHDLGLYVCITRPWYAECSGPGDPHCGRYRFSVHGCGGSPSRAEYVAAMG